MASCNNTFLIRALSLAVALIFGLFLNSVAVAGSTAEDGILERIKPVGAVCIAGQDCGDIAAPVAAAPAGPRSGKDIYDSSCFGCHGTGAAGAPKVGDAADWSSRVAKGMETLLDHGINGFNSMPPRGTCASCSDDDIKAAIQYMVDNSK